MFLLLAVFALVAAACSTAATTTTAGGGGGPEAGVTIKFWSTETQPERLAKTQEIIDRFTEQTGIQVQLTATQEDALPQLMLTNAASGTLPDVVFHPLDFTIGWANAGLLDVDAANEVVEKLGRDTFSQGALELATVDGKVAAVPSDGWGQLLIYRKDLFDAAGLERPDTFEKIEAAAKALHDPANDFYGITAANDPGAVFTQQTFEHFALANGCQLVDDAGGVTLDTPNCVGAIDFFTRLLENYSPGGTQDVVSTRATYFAGQAAMIVWSPFILDEMAGLRDAALPTCPECGDDLAYLAKNSGFVPSFAGPDGAPAQYGQVSYMGIGKTENVAAAKQFVEFWLSEGYLDWLSVAPEGKFPMRRGDADDPTKFIDGWRALETGVDRKAPLSDYYSEEVIDELVEGSNNFDRWGFKQGQGELVAQVYATLIVPQTLDQVFQGQLTPAEAAKTMQELVLQEQQLLEQQD
ncbi:MAG TPA: extracellular solute-binding protein [Actinobacteria bacterium]|nr:extracellular solute-binding protein [Actinomycetota bacterium]